MASVGWIDFSSEHRDKVRTVIDLLKKQGVVDELGIGVIRDSFADRMFPGVSTIQTRAKYFTLTALVIREYERRTERQKEKETLEKYLAREEMWCRPGTAGADRRSGRICRVLPQGPSRLRRRDHR